MSANELQVDSLGRDEVLRINSGDWVEILDGLEAGDRVVTSGNFLIAAEARLKLALDQWAPEAGAGDEAPAPARHDGHAGHAGH